MVGGLPGAYHAGALSGLGGAGPGLDEAELSLAKVADLVEGLEVVGDTLAPFFVGLVLASAEFDLSVVALPLPERQVTALAMAQDPLNTVHQRSSILVYTAQEQRIGVGGEGEADEKVSFTPASLSTVIELIRF